MSNDALRIFGAGHASGWLLVALIAVMTVVMSVALARRRSPDHHD